jgi:hypothetical protein
MKVIFPYAGMGHGLGVQVVNNRAKLSVLGSNGELIGGEPIELNIG